jgi:large subunit ribosomal protein L2
MVSVKNLTVALQRSSGRSTVTGHITVRHRGGGGKRRYPRVDFFRIFHEMPAVVVRSEVDPTRNAFVSLLCYKSGFLSYILGPELLQSGMVVMSSYGGLPIRRGNTMPLEFIPIGSRVHNVQISKSAHFGLVRAAGTSAQVLKKLPGFTLIRMPSSELRLISSECSATVGAVSNAGYKFESLRKAGQSRWLGIRPTVRGVAMNPIDHPHGGGQGKTAGGRPSVTPWARPTKGYRTVRSTNRFIVKRRV